MSARWLLVAALCLPGLARADGGTLVLTRPAGLFVISVFSAPAPLRAGVADVSVLVQERSSAAVVLDAIVALRVHAPDGTTRAWTASHAAATNRLLQAALVELPAAGRWQLEVTVRRARDEATVGCELDVAPAGTRLAAAWPPLAVPPLAIALFVWHQRLRRRRRR